MSPEIAVRGLDFDDVGAEVGQDHGGPGSRDEARQVHHLPEKMLSLAIGCTVGFFAQWSFGFPLRL
jgi:hypothetical protein